jgi:hypothetical protein
MNTLGYDAMTVGNHEFDDGPEVLRGFMDAVKFPVLMSNADVSGEPQLADVLKPSIVIERGGEKIGLIGLTPEDTDELASPGPNVTFSDPVEAVTREAEKHGGGRRQQDHRSQPLRLQGRSGRRRPGRRASTSSSAAIPTPTFRTPPTRRPVPIRPWIDGPDGTADRHRPGLCLRQVPREN